MLQLKDLRAPALTEEATCGCGLGFRLGRVNEQLLAVQIGVHQVHDRNGKPAVTATQTHGHRVCLGKAEIAVDVVHHVQQDRIRGIATVHRTTDFRRGEGAQIVALVVQLAVRLFQPAVEGIPVLAAIHLVLDDIGNRTHPKERIDGALRRSAAGRLKRVCSLGFKIAHRPVLHTTYSISRRLYLVMR